MDALEVINITKSNNNIKEEDMNIKTKLTFGSVLLAGMLVSACSQQNNDEAMVKEATPTGVGHTHPANECTNSIKHTHPNGGGAHKHRYSCKGNARNNMGANQHKHPANKCTRSIAHAHPNGKRTHNHKYSCQGNAKNVGANQRRHPANKCTRSIAHAHPNGKRTHSHKYSCQGNAKNVGANQHRHPANKCTRSISHSHPNGKRTHKHSYSCKGNGKGYNVSALRQQARNILSQNYSTRSKGNGHVHPANSMTRSVRHVHPNGARQHNHRYSK